MKVNEGMLDEMKSWFENNWASGDDFSHYLGWAKHNRNFHIIYGMDDPQKMYLTLLILCDEFVVPKNNRATKFRNYLKSFLNSDTKDKAWYNQVSNYVLDLNVKDIDFLDSGLGTVNRQIRNVPSTDDRGFSREEQRKLFTENFNNSHFALKKANKESQNHGAQKNRPEVDDIYTYSEYSDDKFKADMKGYAVRRACKFLMYDSISKGKNVIYALDDLNLNAIAEKLWLRDNKGTITFETRDSAKTGDGFRKVPVCTTEIREIFRSWDYFKGEYKSGHQRVIFMKEFKKVPPPWETDDLKSWAGYAVHLTAKWFTKLPESVRISKKSLMETVSNSYNTNQYKNAIDAYHSLEIGEFKRGDRNLPKEI